MMMVMSLFAAASSDVPEFHRADFLLDGKILIDGRLVIGLAVLFRL